MRYSSLGLYAQAIVERLAHPAGKRMDDLEGLIADTVDALAAIKEKRWPKSSVSGLRPFRYCEQVKVLSTLIDTEYAQTGKIKAALQRLQEDRNIDDAEVLEEAMRFFRRLAREALKQSHMR